MVVDLNRTPEPVTPTESDVRMAKEATRLLSRLIEQKQPFRLTSGDRAEDAVEIPPSVAVLLLGLLGDMAAGHAVTIVSLHAELTTQQAADLLGVSRPFLVKQIDEGKLPSSKVGSHRRVPLRDLMRYKQQMNTARQASLDELAAEGQDLGLGYCR